MQGYEQDGKRWCRGNKFRFMKISIYFSYKREILLVNLTIDIICSFVALLLEILLLSAIIYTYIYYSKWITQFGFESLLPTVVYSKMSLIFLLSWI